MLFSTPNPDDDLFDLRIKSAQFPSAPVAGIAQQLAEIYYIVGAQQLEGYGQVTMLSIIFSLSPAKHIQFMYFSVDLEE